MLRAAPITGILHPCNSLTYIPVDVSRYRTTTAMQERRAFKPTSTNKIK
jgi:hypothetical protein